jgi:hypothetical protein
MTESKGRYAAGSKVPKFESLDEIQRTIGRFGGRSFAHAEDQGAGRVAIQFEISCEGGGTRRVRFAMALPLEDDFRHVQVNKTVRRLRTDRERWEVYSGEVNRRYRSLANGIKARLSMVEDGIETFEQAFYAHIVLPGGNRTIYEETQAAVAAAYRSGILPELMPGIGSAPMIEAKR